MSVQENTPAGQGELSDGQRHNSRKKNIRAPESVVNAQVSDMWVDDLDSDFSILGDGGCFSTKEGCHRADQVAEAPQAASNSASAESEIGFVEATQSGSGGVSDAAENRLSAGTEAADTAVTVPSPNEALLPQESAAEQVAVLDPFAAALKQALASGAAATAQTRQPATRRVSTALVSIRKPAKTKFFWFCWSVDLELLRGNDANGRETLALPDRALLDDPGIGDILSAHRQVHRLVFCVSTSGARFLMPAARSDTTWFRSFAEFTDVTAKTCVGPFKRVSDMGAGQYVFHEALEPKEYTPIAEDLDTSRILRQALPVITSAEDPFIRRLLGYDLSEGM